MEFKKVSIEDKNHEQHENFSSYHQFSNESDSSFSIQKEQKFLPKKTHQDQNQQSQKKGGKFGLKYAKISNKQRQALVEEVTSTGCTIKSAARTLNINFSTAKAIMQIYRREGRIAKKIVRDLKQKTSESPIHHSKESSKESEKEDKQVKKVKVGATQDNIDTYSILQAEETNKQQAYFIQQLQQQNLYLSTQVTTLQQDKVELNQKCEFLMAQYQQLRIMASQVYPYNYYPLHVIQQ